MPVKNRAGGNPIKTTMQSKPLPIEQYSDAALLNEIAYLREYDHTGKWGDSRLAELTQEARLRHLKF
jgi:hypothetical protein